MPRNITWLTLGPPSESCELTRLRSTTSKNLQNSPTVRCVRYIYRSDERTIEILVPPAMFAISVTLPFFSVYVCVCVHLCVCVCVLRASASHVCFPRSASDESSTARRYTISYVDVYLPCTCVPLFLQISYPIDESASCYFLGPAGPSPPYMPLMSILRLAVFLSLWSLKNWCEND